MSLLVNRCYYRNDTAHRTLSNSPTDGTLSCGFMYKPSTAFTQRNLIFDYYGAFFLLDGSGRYTDEYGREHFLGPGSYCQRLPGVSHTTEVDGNGQWLEFYVCFGRRTYEALLELNFLSSEPVLYPGPSSSVLNKCIHLLDSFKRYSEEQTGVLFTEAINFAIEETAAARHNLSDITNYQMQQACELLAAIGPESRSPNEVAEYLQMPYENFRKKFKAVYGESPGQYRLDCRIDESKRLLLDTQKSISEIAQLCNFADSFSYSKCFKKRTGESPRAFRCKRLGI